MDCDICAICDICDIGPPFPRNWTVHIVIRGTWLIHMVGARKNTMLAQCWDIVAEDDPTLRQHRVNVSCLLGKTFLFNAGPTS